jgi:hypothetical protein
MLEILAVIGFAKLLSSAAVERGRSKGWAALGVGFWIGGELMGAIIAGILGLDDLAIYGVALMVAGVGVLIAYLVVKALPPLELPATAEIPTATLV